MRGGIAAIEGVDEDLLRALLELRRVLIARHEDEAGDEALEDVLAREEREALALLQQQDAPRDFEEIGVGDLQELVAGEGLEDVDECLAVVRMRIESGADHHAIELEAQHRD